MAAPDNAGDILPVYYQIGLAAITFLVAAAGIVWQFINKFKQEPEHEQKVVLERAELADMNPLREFIRDFRPALEKLSHIEQSSAHNTQLIQEALAKLSKMERAAEVAKEVREELARRVDEQERYTRRHRENRDHRDE